MTNWTNSLPLTNLYGLKVLKFRLKHNTDGAMKSTAQTCSNINKNPLKTSSNINPIKSGCYMRSTVIGCRNHLLFFIGKGAKAIVCNRIVTIRVLRYPQLFEIL